ncbi:transposase [Rhodococcus erythropolis]|nr:transposase [Rhodococcus erythropolis]MCW2295411.1 transposase [Rhodococcus erythropolis]
MTEDLLPMRDWLISEHVSVVGMEATGAYWKPIFYLLESDIECWLLNARHMKTVPGRKTDVKDSEWIAKLIEHGPVRPSFVPPQPIRQLRDLTRYRTEVVRERTRELQRLHNLLEDAGIKVDHRRFRRDGKIRPCNARGFDRGRTRPGVLAELALGRLRVKRASLIEALTERFTDHHGFLARAMLDRIDSVTEMQSRLDARIDELVEPYRRKIELLATVRRQRTHRRNRSSPRSGPTSHSSPPQGIWHRGPGCVRATTNPPAKVPPEQPDRVIPGSKVFWNRHRSPHLEVKTATSVRATDE